MFSYSLEYFHGDYQSVGATDHLMDKGANNHYLNNFVSLYNGNIGAMITNLTKQDETVNLQAQMFRYDNLNRIRNSMAVSKLDYNLRTGGNTWNNSEIVGSVIGGSFQNGLATTYTYDPAGNISDLTRTDLTGNLFDNFHYNYETLTINGLGQDIGSKNRLFQVTDTVTPSVKTDDFDFQVNADNYVYDKLGRIVEDKAKNLVQTYNKENKIITQTIGSKVVTYKYDFQSKRVSKTVVNAGLTTTEYYVRDPQGNVLAIYADTLQNADRKFTLSELHIYGSSRLGTYKVDSELYSQNGSTIVIATSSNKYSFKLGQKRYELSNHLGNVSTTISDRKLVDTESNGLITAYKADVQSVTDYYPFGKTISERTWSISKTRYDFNGKETDQESGYQDYGFRDYDVEICRFLQVDPLFKDYPEYTSYQFAGNTPIGASDLDGAEPDIDISKWSKSPGYKDWGNLYNDEYSYQTVKSSDGVYYHVVSSEVTLLGTREFHYRNANSKTDPYHPFTPVGYVSEEERSANRAQGLINFSNFMSKGLALTSTSLVGIGLPSMSLGLASRFGVALYEDYIGQAIVTGGDENEMNLTSFGANIISAKYQTYGFILKNLVSSYGEYSIKNDFSMLTDKDWTKEGALANAIIGMTFDKTLDFLRADPKMKINVTTGKHPDNNSNIIFRTENKRAFELGELRSEFSRLTNVGALVNAASNKLGSNAKENINKSLKKD